MTGGNPFFLTEALAAPPASPPRAWPMPCGRGCAGSGPSGVHTLVGRSRSSPRACELPCCGSWAAMEALAEAEQRGILEVRDAGISFRHELARRAVEGTLSRLRRRALNRAVVQALHRSGDPDPERLVHHAVEADEAATIVAYAPRAGRAAAAAGSHRQALAHFEAARPHATRLARREQARLADDYSWALYIAHRFTDAVTAGRRGGAALRAARRPRRAGRVPGPAVAPRLHDRRHRRDRARARASGAGAEHGRVGARARRRLHVPGAVLTLTGRTVEAVPVLHYARQLAAGTARPDLSRSV